MAKIKSVFGVYADRLQVLVDSSLDKFAPVWFPKYFDWGTPQMQLTYVNAIGRSRIEAAASVVDRNSKAPLRSRAQLEKYNGTIPAIMEKIPMNQDDYRDFYTLQSIQNIDEATKKQQLLDLLFNDVKLVGSAAMKRLDHMILQAVSTGIIQINTTNNPDGLVMTDIDLLMPAGNKSNSTTSWDNVAATPLTVDIPTIVKAGEDVGRSFVKMLMSRTQFLNFQKITEVKNLLSNYLGFKQAGNILATLDNINIMLEANGWPIIEIVNEVIGVESDGIIGTQRPWNDNNVSFIPAGKLGTIKNALAIEQLQPVGEVNYATYERALISKWRENDPFAEFTQVELNAFPALEQINGIFILTAVH
jgi:hypothetical protein